MGRLAFCIAVMAVAGCRPLTVEQDLRGRWFGRDEVLVFLGEGKGYRMPRSGREDRRTGFAWRTKGNTLHFEPGGDARFEVATTVRGLELALTDGRGRTNRYVYD